MVSTSKPAVAESIVTATSTPAARPVARLNARISAYLVDSIILVAFILVFFVAGGSILLFTSDLGKGDAPDEAYYAAISVFLGGCLLTWSAFNIALMRWRGQTAGMYVVGIKTVGIDTAPLSTGRTLLRWFGLHPLLFHPLLLPIWGILSLLVVSLTLSSIVLVITIALVLLCIVSPIASMVAMMLDTERRAPHDRLAQTLVVHFEQP